MNIDNNKPVSVSINTTITFYEEAPKRDIFGSNEVGYELYYNTKNGILQVLELGSFGDRTLVKQLQDRRGRGITVDEMLENIHEIKDMTYKEFKEKILKVEENNESKRYI